MNDNTFKIADYLSKGAENAKNTKYLASTYHLTAREIRFMVEAERQSGTLICSNSQGYFIANSMSEVVEWANSMQGRIKVMKSNCASVMEAAKRTF